MPEGPETQKQVDNVRSWLLPELPKSSPLYFLGIDKFGDRYASVDITMLNKCLDKPIQDIYCKGKEYFLQFDADTCIWAHHMRAGDWLIGGIEDQPPIVQKNIHFRLHFGNVKDGKLIDREVTLLFHNPSFGKFEILTTAAQIESKLSKLASGFIGRFQHTEDSWAAVYNKIGKRRLLIKLLRDDQQVCCSGIGNYLIAEIFYAMKFHPKITMKSIDQDLWMELFHTCMEVVNGHYNGNREKVIYKQKKSPIGNPIVGHDVSGRTMWYSPIEQIVGKP